MQGAAAVFPIAIGTANREVKCATFGAVAAWWTRQRVKSTPLFADAKIYKGRGVEKKIFFFAFIEQPLIFYKRQLYIIVHRLFYLFTKHL